MARKPQVTHKKNKVTSNNFCFRITMENEENRKRKSQYGLTREFPKRGRLILEAFECPVCMELPRGGPIKGCRNGHIICQTCHQKMEKCPICAEKDITCRNLIAENTLDTLLTNMTIECKHQPCQITQTFRTIKLHEDLCRNRIIPCLGAEKGCTWTGPITRAIKHINEKQCACTIIDEEYKIQRQQTKANQKDQQHSKNTENNEPNKTITFKLKVDDLSTPVFETNKHLQWKPIALLGPKTYRLWIYTKIERKQDMIWRIKTKTTTTQEISDTIQCKTTIIEAKGDTEILTKEATMCSNDTPCKPTKCTKCTTHINNETVKSIRTKETLFRVRIEITLPKEI